MFFRSSSLSVHLFLLCIFPVSFLFSLHPLSSLHFLPPFQYGTTVVPLSPQRQQKTHVSDAHREREGRQWPSVWGLERVPSGHRGSMHFWLDGPTTSSVGEVLRGNKHTPHLPRSMSLETPSHQPWQPSKATGPSALRSTGRCNSGPWEDWIPTLVPTPQWWATSPYLFFKIPNNSYLPFMASPGCLLLPDRPGLLPTVSWINNRFWILLTFWLLTFESGVFGAADRA